MGIDCTGMGGSGNVKSHSRASLLCTHEEAQRLVCNLWLIDSIEQIGHSDANIEWSSGEDLD